MGAAHIVESSLSETSASFWSKVGNKIPEIPLDTSKYSRGFVSFAMVVGLYATVKASICGVKHLRKALKVNTALTDEKFR